MSYFGREFLLESQENYEKILELIFPDLPDIAKEALSNFKTATVIEKDGDKYILTHTEINNQIKTSIFRNGGGDENSTAKITCSVEGDTYIRVLEMTDGSVTFKSEFSADELIETIKHSKWDGECKRYYKAVG